MLHLLQKALLLTGVFGSSFGSAFAVGSHLQSPAPSPGFQTGIAAIQQSRSDSYQQGLECAESPSCNSTVQNQ